MLRTRILTAVALFAGLLAAVFWLPVVGWTVLVGVLLALAGWEWSGLSGLRALGTSGRAVYAGAVAAAGVGAGWSAGSGAHEIAGHLWLYLAGAGFWVVLAPLWLWARPTFVTAVIPLVAGMVVLVPSAAAMVALRRESPFLLLAIMAVAWISDIAAYFAGRRFGRRKLAPSISPGKSWEGVYGALAAVTVYATGWLAAGGSMPLALPRTALGEMWFVLLLLGFAAAGIAGDLLESQMKRQAGVKDSGKLLPGHGGVLDRIDALLAVLPLAALAFLG